MRTHHPNLSPPINHFGEDVNFVRIYRMLIPLIYGWEIHVSPYVFLEVNKPVNFDLGKCNGDISVCKGRCCEIFEFILTLATYRVSQNLHSLHRREKFTHILSQSYPSAPFSFWNVNRELNFGGFWMCHHTFWGRLENFNLIRGNEKHFQRKKQKTKGSNWIRTWKFNQCSRLVTRLATNKHGPLSKLRNIIWNQEENHQVGKEMKIMNDQPKPWASQSIDQGVQCLLYID